MEGASGEGSEWKECTVALGLLEGAWSRKYCEASLELGGGWSPKDAEGVRGRSWKNSKTALEQKTGRPLTDTTVQCKFYHWAFVCPILLIIIDDHS